MNDQPEAGTGAEQPLADLPGGAKAALEAILMVLDQPATEEELAAGLDITVDTVRALLAELQREYTGSTVKAPDVE